MDINEILFTEELKARIIDLEYDQLTVENIRQIYFEETGKELKVEITIYLSKDFEDDFDIGENGFDGTIIHFFDKDKVINQIYSIARGSEGTEQESWKPEDWLYNLMGIYVGGNKSQYDDAKVFENEITEIIFKKTGDHIDLVKIALGHSLGGNTKQLQQLVDDEYDLVYVFNDAPPTYYQLARIDRDFWDAILSEFNIYEFTHIYDLDPKLLKEFTQNYYKDAAKNIHHITAEEDFLYNLSHGVRGFVHLGSYEMVNAIPGFEGLKDMFEKIPDSVAADLQKYFAGFTDIYNQDGFDGFLSEVLGVDAALITKIMEMDGFELGLLWDLPDINRNANNLARKIPEVVESLTLIRDNLDPILSVFIDAGYIEEEFKEDVKKEIDGIMNQLEALKNLIDYNGGIKLHHVVIFYINFKSLLDRFEKLKGYMGDFFEDVSASIDAHGLYTVINALNKGGNKVYRGGDLYWVGNGGHGSEISINISASQRIYQVSMQMYDHMESKLREMKSLFDSSYLADYETRKRKLMAEIRDMEAYPGKYNNEFFTHTYDTQYFRLIRKIDVHEEINPLPPAFLENFETMFDYYAKEIERGRSQITRMKELADSFINKEEDVAAAISNFKMAE